MARDASGNYSLPGTNPVVSDTDITTTWANGTMADLAAEIEDSLSRSGKGGMLVAFLNSDGTVAAPGMSFTNDSTTGIYRKTSATPGLGLAYLGNLVALVRAGGVDVTGNLTASGNATITGTLGVTGVATFAATPVFSAGISGLTRSNLPAAGEEIGGAGSFGGNSTVINDLSAEITLPSVTGRPVIVMVQPGDGSSANGIIFGADGSGNRTGSVYIYRSINGGAFSAIACYYFYAAAGTYTVTKESMKALPIGPFIDTPGAGSIKYKLRYLVSNAGAYLYNEGMVVAAYEL